MRQADPKTSTRQERFRAYCRAKGWQNESGTWKISDIAKATGKASQKVSDLLNGTGSFGAQIARQLEDVLPGMHPGYLDDMGTPHLFGEDVETGSPNMDIANFEPLRPPTIAEALQALAKAMREMNDSGRKVAATMLQEFPKDLSEAGAQKAAETLATLHRSFPAAPSEPEPPKPKKTAARRQQQTAKADKAPAKSRLTVTVGGGQKSQYDLPLKKTVRDPFSDSPPPSEAKWYKSLKRPQ